MRQSIQKYLVKHLTNKMVLSVYLSLKLVPSLMPQSLLARQARKQGWRKAEQRLVPNLYLGWPCPSTLGVSHLFVPYRVTPLHFSVQRWSATHPFRSMAVMTFGRFRAWRMVSFFSPRTTSSIWPVGASLYLITCKWLLSSELGKGPSQTGEANGLAAFETLAPQPFPSPTGWTRVTTCTVSC